MHQFAAAHMTVIGAHSFAVAQITTINSVYMKIISLRFSHRAFKATACSVLNNNTLSTQLERFAKRSPISPKGILSLHGICPIVASNE
jgi:hypothetical protein